jgi:hypothetical protein
MEPRDVPPVIETPAPALAPEPAAISISPALPCEDAPVPNSRAPDGPSDDAPDETLTAPLSPESAEAITTEPLAAAPTPLATTTEPPTPSSATDEPLLNVRSPPLPEELEPAPITIAPLSLDTESPVVSASEPDAALLDVPVDTDTDPLLSPSSPLWSLVTTATAAPAAL